MYLSGSFIFMTSFEIILKLLFLYNILKDIINNKKIGNKIIEPLKFEYLNIFPKNKINEPISNIELKIWLNLLNILHILF